MGILRAFVPSDNTPAQPGYVSQAEHNALVRRVGDLEARVRFLESRPNMGDKTRPIDWGSVGDAYYHRDPDYNDLAGVLSQAAPWVSSTVRFAESLTSPQFIKATGLQAGLFAVTFAGAGAVAALWLELPWYASPTIGLAGFALSAGVLGIHNRTMLARLTRAQAEKGQRRRHELRVQVDRAADHGADFLYLNSDVTPAQLAEFARAAIEGASLGVHKWTGQGALFTRGQYEDLMTELVKMGYVNDSRGNVGRSLNSKGRALMRALAEKAGE